MKVPVMGARKRLAPTFLVGTHRKRVVRSPPFYGAPSCAESREWVISSVNALVRCVQACGQ
jgi:hypothetical protein